MLNVSDPVHAIPSVHRSDASGRDASATRPPWPPTPSVATPSLPCLIN